MATKAITEEPEPTPVRRIVAAVKHEVGDKHNRAISLLAISAGMAALAPMPFGAVAAAALVVVAGERGRR